jgi:spore maturation protein CgeB/dTDP-glucose pyrophosphorylase
MKVVIFGLAVTSSWGNGHATLWRALCKAMAKRGHRVVFFEKDVPYYADNRDLHSLPGGGDLVLYSDFDDVASIARLHANGADLALVTSYCPDAQRASDLVVDSKAAIRGFYDLDTPVTLQSLRMGKCVEYLPAERLSNFDLVLSYTGGRSLNDLCTLLGARRVAALHGCVDEEVNAPAEPYDEFRCDLSYLGTYAADRQSLLESLFVEPARRLPKLRFLIGGAQYPESFPWRENISFVRHLPPCLHPSFFSSSRATLNVTRKSMADYGYCPSGRLFEAAACGVPILSDVWDGLSDFFTPGLEISTVRCAQDVIDALERSDEELRQMANAARERTLASHTAEQRVKELEAICSKFRHDSKPKPETIPHVSVTSHESMHDVWGIIPAAGIGSRIQPLAFSKELLPVGSRVDNGQERPRAVSEYLIERMIAGGVTKLCFVISPNKADILQYYTSGIDGTDVVYAVQPSPGGLCDAVFRALPAIPKEAEVIVGLPDTIWFPKDGLTKLPNGCLSFLLFPVGHPEFFDAVVIDEHGKVIEIEVKTQSPHSNWIWGAFKMPGRIFHELYALWKMPERRDEYFGTLINAYLRSGGHAVGITAGEAYVDVGTLHGYREASRLLSQGITEVPLFREDATESVNHAAEHESGTRSAQ